MQTKIKIQWLVDVVGAGDGRVSLGFCEAEPLRVAFVAPNTGMAVLLPMVVRDAYITMKGCEEGKRCLVKTCRYNCTTFTSYRNSATWKKNSLPRAKNFDILLTRVAEWESMLANDIQTIDWQKDFTYVYPKPTIILRREKA